MEEWFENCTGYVLNAWQNTTGLHYAQLLIAVVLVGWYVRRFRGE